MVGYARYRRGRGTFRLEGLLDLAVKVTGDFKTNHFNRVLNTRSQAQRKCVYKGNKHSRSRKLAGAITKRMPWETAQESIFLQDNLPVSMG